MTSLAMRRSISLINSSLKKLSSVQSRSVVSGRNDIRVINYLQNEEVERHRRSRLSQHPEPDESKETEEQLEMPRDFRYVHPEFLPTTVSEHRDRLREKLEREDMYRRRGNLNIPEFYVGSIVAVTVADPHSSSKTTRFLGICTQRGGYGLRSHFILRNVIDGQGVEVMYEMYNPVVQKIEVIKLEKRLDEDLMYLRDAPPQYSTFPQDMEPIPLPKGSTVPVNTLKVKLNPRPWHERWERQELRGVEKVQVSEKLKKKAAAVKKPWEKYDLMKQYRSSVNDVEAEQVMRELFIRKQKFDQERAVKERKSDLEKKR